MAPSYTYYPGATIEPDISAILAAGALARIEFAEVAAITFDLSPSVIEFSPIPANAIINEDTRNVLFDEDSGAMLTAEEPT